MEYGVTAHVRAHPSINTGYSSRQLCSFHVFAGVSLHGPHDQALRRPATLTLPLQARSSFLYRGDQQEKSEM